MINMTINIPCVLLIKVELKPNILMAKVSPITGAIVLNMNNIKVIHTTPLKFLTLSFFIHMS